MSRSGIAVIVLLGVAFLAMWIVPLLADMSGWPLAIGIAVAGAGGLMFYDWHGVRRSKRSP